MNSKVRATMAMLVGLLVFLTATQSMAQSVTPLSLTSEFEVTGTISALNATNITVDGRVFNIATAEIKSTIRLGALVKVHYTIAASGSFVAREVEPGLAADLNNLDDDVNDDVATHDLNDDHGDDGATHDLNDDHGNDGATHDANDDHGGRGRGGDNGTNNTSGRGGGDDDGGHHSGGDD